MARTGLHLPRRDAAPGALAVLTALGLVLAAVAGCSSATAAAKNPQVPGTCLSSAGVPLTIVVGDRSNVPNIQFPAQVTSLLTTAATDKEPITLIRIDGAPKVFHLPPFATNDINSGAIQQDITNYVDGVIDILNGSRLHAVAPQADDLAALSLAAAATPRGGNIVVIDSGLQTAGSLDYQAPGMLMAAPGDLVTFLRAKSLIPDLGGRHVLLSGLGYAAAPQATLDQPEQENVAAQWKAIVAAAGACVTVDPTPNTNDELTGLPAVSTVPLPVPPTFRTCGTTVLSDAGSVGFNVGSASFRDPVAARSTLSELASVLRQGAEPITLIGSTSTEGGDAINNPLSTARAAAVKSVLVALGVDGSRISVVGDGSHYPQRVSDIGPNGQLLPAQAEQDREVIVQLPRCQ